MTEEQKSETPKINVPETEIDMPILTLRHLRELESEADERVSRIQEEFQKGFDFIKHHPKSVTIFGSARFDENNKHYQKARSIAAKISSEGYAVATGGGPGIMEAGNRGALEGDGNDFSLGICIKLPH